jgi:hypothetical protein
MSSISSAALAASVSASSEQECALSRSASGMSSVVPSSGSIGQASPVSKTSTKLTQTVQWGSAESKKALTDEEQSHG